MSAKAKTDAQDADSQDDEGKLVTLYPIPGAYLPGVPAVETEVSAREAKRLLKFDPPAFTTERPPDPPEEPAASTEGPADAGPSDVKPEE